jgi:hypothetical protein
MTQPITKLGTQPHTKFQSRRSNIAVRAVMDVFDVSQAAAQGEMYRPERIAAYAALRLAGVK